MPQNLNKSNTITSIDHTYDFHCAIQRIEQMHPEAASLGEGDDPSHEAVILKSHISDAIPDHELHTIENERTRPIVWMNLVSLGGRGGPLPEVYSDMLKERQRYKDHAFRDFLDIFNHRLASLWYRLRQKTLAGFVQKPAKETPVGEAGLCLSGIPNTKILEKTTLKPSLLLAAQTLLWARHRSVESLKTLLEDYFHYSVKIEPWQGGWNNISDNETTRLGGPWNALGRDTILGKRSWNAMQGLHLHIYNVNAHMKFPEAQWRDVLRLYIGLHMRVHITLHYDRPNIQPIRLRPKKGFFLGRNTWLGPKPQINPNPQYTFLILRTAS